MNFRRLLLVVFACVLLVGSALWLAFPYLERFELSRRIDDLVFRATAPGADGVVDFGQLDLFAWDTMYVFRPYTPHGTVDAALGFSWDGIDAVGIERRDDINLLVFTSDRSVVAYLALPRSKLDFAHSDYQAFAPRSARFHTRAASDSRTVLLTPGAP